MNEHQLVPHIRFQGFADEWEECAFSKILHYKDGIKRGPFGSSLKKESFVTKSKYAVYEQQNAIYDNYETRYNISQSKFEALKKFEILPGDFIMSGAGTVGKISEVPSGIKKGIFNQALIRFRINTKVIYRKYFLTYMRSEIMHRKLTEKNPGSAITNLVSMKEVKNFLVRLPQLSEQQKIGNLFAKLDQLLDLQQQKLDQLDLLKKALLQNLFPAQGAKIPALRFQGFEDEWEQRKLGEISDRFDNIRIPITKSKRTSGNIPYYGANGIQDYVKGFTHEGEYLLIAEDGASDLKNYPVNYVNGKVWVNNHAHVISAKSNYADNKFLMNAIKRINFEAYIVGSSRSKLNADTMMKIPVNIPNVHEQEKIGTFLAKLDQLLDLQQHKLDKIKQVKKALLQNMFVE
jgi:type I restriction enzyme, S subunit